MPTPKLIFPLGFDVDGALPDAQKDLERALKRLEHIAGNTPLLSKIEVDQAGLARMNQAYTETIDSIRSKLAKLSKFWDQLQPVERFNSARNGLSTTQYTYDVGTKKTPDPWTKSAKEVYEEYIQLTEVLRTFGKSLSELHSDHMNKIDAELRQIRKETQEYKNQQQVLAQLEQERKRQFAAQNTLKSSDADVKKATDAYRIQATKVLNLKTAFENATAAREQMERAGTHKKDNGTFTQAYADALELEKKASLEYTQATKELTSAISAKIAAEERSLNQIEREKIALERQRNMIQELDKAINNAQLSRLRLVPNLTELEKANKAVSDQRTLVNDLAAKYRAAKSEREKFDGVLPTKDAYDRNKFQTKEYQEALRVEREAATALLQAENRLTNAMQHRLDVQIRADEQARRDAISVNNLNIAVSDLKNRIMDLQNNQANLGQYSSQFQKITQAMSDQQAVAQLLRDELRLATDARKAFENTGKTKNKDNTANRAYIDALEHEKRVAQQLNQAEQQLLNTQTQRLNLLRQIGLSGNLEVGVNWGAHDAGAIDSQIARYNQLKELIRGLGVEYERLKAIHNAAGTDITADANANRILKERLEAQKELTRITQTADHAQAEYAKKLEAKERVLQARIERRTQARRQELLQTLRENAALRLQENSISNIQQRLAAAQAKLSRINFTTDPQGFKDAQNEVKRLMELLDKYQVKAESVGRAHKNSSNKVNSALKDQGQYIQRLIDRMAVYASFGAIGNFLSKVREVTAQFELQRVSLGAIIQDQVKANSLFTQIQAFALKSPLSIMQLTRYTKQVAAYRIETDKLFDVTKRLADVSVGLGVDMQRLVLAYGQVKAATYLRAAEVRQFTEAGIPMLELLADKFTKLEGHVVSTADVMKRISERGVEFKQVEEIFNDMTSAGGMFYDMQEKQGNTLFGLWAKLGDAASLMYNEIGNTTIVNGAIRGLIKLLMAMMHSWAGLRNTIIVVGTAFAWMKLAAARQKALLELSTKHTVATKAYVTALNEVTVAESRLAKVRHTGNSALIKSAEGQLTAAKQMVKITALQRKAAATTNILAKGWYNLQAAMVGVGSTMLWVVGIMAAMAIAERIFANWNKLEREKEKIQKEADVEMRKSVYNFESLANAAVKATEGSKQQRDALDELRRTYRDVIPEHDLTIEKLRALKGNYDSLTNSVQEYIAVQMKQKAVDTIISHTEEKIVHAKNMAKGFLGVFVSDAEVNRIIANLEKIVRNNPLIEQRDAIDQALKNVIGEGYEEFFESIDMRREGVKKQLKDLTEAIANQQLEIQKLDGEYADLVNDLGVYQERFKELQETFENSDLAIDGKAVDLNTYFGQQVKTNAQIKDVYVAMIKEMLADAGVAWSDGMVNLVENVNENNPGTITTLAFERIHEALENQKDELLKQIKETNEQIEAETNEAKKATLQSSLDDMEKNYNKFNNIVLWIDKIQKLYNNLVPTSQVVRVIRQRLNDIVESAGDNMSRYTQYLMGADKSMEQYAKDLKSSIESLKSRVKELVNIQAAVALAGVKAKEMFGYTSEELAEEIKNTQMMTDVLQKLFDSLPSFEKGSGRNDTRLSEATSALSELEKMYNKYKEFAKTMSEDSAYNKVNDYFRETIALIKEVSNGKIDIKLPKNAEEYKREMQKILNYIKTLPKSKRAQIEAQLKINDVDYTEAQEALEKMLKNLSKQISESKAARDFFKSIFDQSQSYDMAMNLTMSVYGEDGANYNELIQQQIRTLFGAGDETRIEIDVEPALDIDTKTVNYNKLAEIFTANMDKIPQKYWESIQKIIDDGRKFNADQAKQWMKDLADVRSWAEKRVDLARSTAERIREIRSKDNLSESVKNRMIEQYKFREAKEADKLLYETFKNSPMYVALFNNLESTTTASLTAMREKLAQFRDEMRKLDPTQLKEVQSRISEIEDQLMERNANPFGQLKELFNEFNPEKMGSWAERLNIGAANEGLGDNITTIQQVNSLMNELSKSQITKQAELNRLIGEGVSEDDERIKVLVNELNILEHQLNFLSGMSNEYTTIQKKIKKVWAGADKIKEGVIKVADAAYDMAEAFGASEDALALFKDIQNTINLVYNLTQSITSAVWAMSKTTAQGVSMVEKASIILTVISTALQVATALFNLFANAKARKLEKQIQKEQKLIDALSYSYERLKDASDKLYGDEYINNYNQRLKQLEQMQISYQKQAELERQKGKKADENKIKEYQEAARDAGDQIKDMQAELVNRMAGTDLATAAKDFADAWRDAYIEFGNTTDAISEKFTEMINNMVVESLMAKVVQAQLQPFFDEIDRLAKDGEMTAADIADVVAGVPDAVKSIDEGLKITIAQLQAAGVDIRNLKSDTEFTGIARDIASASEESINGLAAMINTQNYYISHVPLIYQEVVLIRTLLSGGDVSLGTDKTANVDLLTLQNEYLANLPTISSNTTVIAERCERAVQVCEEIAENLGKVIKPVGIDSGWVVRTNI